jgi:hypothetical protein
VLKSGLGGLVRGGGWMGNEAGYLGRRVRAECSESRIRKIGDDDGCHEFHYEYSVLTLTFHVVCFVPDSSEAFCLHVSSAVITSRWD